MDEQDTYFEIEPWGCPRCGQWQPIIRSCGDAFDSNGYSGGSIATSQQWCLRCGVHIHACHGELTARQAFDDPEAGPLPSTDPKAVDLLVALLDTDEPLSLILQSDIAWCLKYILEVADARLDESDPIHLRLAAETVARLAADQEACGARVAAYIEAARARERAREEQLALNAEDSAE